MAYTKTHNPWVAGDAVSLAALDNFETIYTEISSYLSTHTHDASYYTKNEMESTFWYAGNDGAASGSDADLIYKSTGNLHAASFAGLGIPTGLVIWWYGSIASIPSGWQLADGTNGTIDLRNMMVVGAGTGSAYTPGDTGTGSHTPTGTITIGTHSLIAAEIRHVHDFQDKYAAGSGTGAVNSPGQTRKYATTGGGHYDSMTGDSNIGKATADAHGHLGSTTTINAFTALPPYHALAFIQKM
jgi:hypothetical protein